jgi:hypothetical protein
LTIARDIDATLVPRLKENDTHLSIWHDFQADPDSARPLLEAAVDMLLSADAALARRLDALLEQYRQAQGAARSSVDTGGGAYVGGGVTVSGGDFVGRDKHTVTVTGDGNVVGDHSSATVIKRMGVPPAEVAALFDQALALARQRPPDVQEDLEAAVETAREEVERGDEADKGLLSKALDVLLEEGPDVLEIVLQAILNPAAAAGKGARMLAKHARKSLQKKRRSS